MPCWLDSFEGIWCARIPCLSIMIAHLMSNLPRWEVTVTIRKCVPAKERKKKGPWVSMSQAAATLQERYGSSHVRF